MNTILAIADQPRHDLLLLDEVSALHPRRVTVVVDGDDRTWAWDETADGRARRDRLAALITAISKRTGAAVVGTVARPEVAPREGYDAVVAPGLAVAA
ncbi:MAG: hypothetical protein U0T02_05870 [Solirubrobacteraceae bacterium]